VAARRVELTDGEGWRNPDYSWLYFEKEHDCSPYYVIVAMHESDASDDYGSVSGASYGASSSCIMFKL
jgi:hypothetical protein